VARFSGGWFPTPRSWWHDDPQVNPFGKDLRLPVLMSLLCAWANYQDTEACKRGQLVTGVDDLARMSKSLGWSRSMTWRLLQKLKFLSKIETTIETRGTVVTILDYEALCDAAKESETENETGVKQERNESETLWNKVITESGNPPPNPQAGDGTALFKDEAHHNRAEKKKRTRKALGDPGEAQAIVTAWNEHKAAVMRSCRDVTEKRTKKLLARWKEKPDAAYWVAVVQQLATSSWHCGENDSHWVADIDWLIRDCTNHVRIAERIGQRPVKAANTSLDIWRDIK
jgi:hypothetical protein